MDQQKADKDAQEERRVRVENLADSLLTKRDEAIAGRAATGIERTWREDQRAFEGLDGTSTKSDMTDYATGEASGGSNGKMQRRSRVIVNIIRGKCETAEGRFTEIQFPTDDKNFGIDSTPVGELAMPMDIPEGIVQASPEQLVEDPSQAPMQDPMAAQDPMGAPQQEEVIEAPQEPSEEREARARKDELKKRASAMESEIDDQLEECDYNAECRKVARSAIRLGTGVMKGPNIVKTTRRAWVEQKDSDGSVHTLKVVENLKPASASRDIWNIYPDPHCGDNPKKGAYIWERDHLLPRELRALMGVPGYSKQQIIRVLQEDPVRTVVQLDKGNNQQVRASTIARGAPYERWEYNGDVDKDDLIAMGVKVDEDSDESISACVVFVNNHPIKAQLNMLDSGELPYDFFPWVQVDDSPWGMSEPRKLIWQQRIITAAWRAMMDNAGDSSGAQIVIGRNVRPEDDVWEVTGKKIWIDESEDSDVKKAFQQFQIQNNQGELQNIINLALEFMDLESGTPRQAQGQQSTSGTKTLGELQILMQGADTTRRRQVKQWDDLITRPHIGRYYHWNMMYNPKPEIKGDFDVVARGTSVLIVKDENAQKLMQIMQLRNDPDAAVIVDWEKVIKQLFESQHLDVIKDEDAIKEAREKQAQQQPQADPRIEVANIAAKGRSEVAGITAKTKEDEMVANTQVRMEELKIDDVNADEDRKLKDKEINGKLSAENDKLKAKLAEVTMNLQVQQKENQLARAQRDDHIVADHSMRHEDRKQTRAQKQIAKTGVEPAGKAPAGEAFSL